MASAKRNDDAEARQIWIRFAESYYLFRGTPTRMWLDYAFQELFGLEERLSENNADLYYDTISEKLNTPQFLPRALYERFNIEVLATTDSPLDPLAYHQAIRDSGWKARIIPAFRPDSVVDPDFPGFAERLPNSASRTARIASRWTAICMPSAMRARDSDAGLTATDHGHPTAPTADLRRRGRRRALRSRHRRQSRCAGAGTLPRSDAHGNGAHEPGRRPGDADSSWQPSQSQPPGL